MQRAFELVRSDNWWDSKIPPLLAIACLQMLAAPVSPLLALAGLLAFLVWAVCIAAYAHIVNDISDLEADLDAGKVRRIARLAPWQRPVLAALLALASVSLFLVVPLSLPLAVLQVLMLAIPVVYSVPPFRFKERGILGVITDACQAHLVPTLFVVEVFKSLTLTTPAYAPLFTLAVGIWALMLGLRGILVHQLWDRDQDVAARVRTFVIQAGTERTRQRVTRFVFPVELLALVALALFVLSAAPWVVGVIIVSLLVDLVRFDWKGKILFDPAPVTPDAYLPLTDLYQLWLPLTLAVLLARQDVLFLILVAAELLLFYSNLKWRGRWTLYMLAAPFQRLYLAYMGRARK